MHFKYCLVKDGKTHVKTGMVKGRHAMERMQKEQDQKGLNSDIQEWKLLPHIIFSHAV